MNKNGMSVNGQCGLDGLKSLFLRVCVSMTDLYLRSAEAINSVKSSNEGVL